MKAEIAFSEEMIEAIAERVAERLRSVLEMNMDSSYHDDILDVKGLAKYMKVSEKWVYKYRTEIPHYKLNGHLRFRKKEIDQWFLTQEMPLL